MSTCLHYTLRNPWGTFKDHGTLVNVSWKIIGLPKPRLKSSDLDHSRIRWIFPKKNIILQTGAIKTWNRRLSILHKLYLPIGKCQVQPQTSVDFGLTQKLTLQNFQLVQSVLVLVCQPVDVHCRKWVERVQRKSVSRSIRHSILILRHNIVIVTSVRLTHVHTAKNLKCSRKNLNTTSVHDVALTNGWRHSLWRAIFITRRISDVTTPTHYRIALNSESPIVKDFKLVGGMTSLLYIGDVIMMTFTSLCLCWRLLSLAECFLTNKKRSLFSESTKSLEAASPGRGGSSAGGAAVYVIRYGDVRRVGVQ